LLEQDSACPSRATSAVVASADHLSGLIDGILDISKIEAGRIYLSRDEVRLSEFLDQLVGMFRVQAAAKGIDFVFKRPAVLPVVVYADEKRLRQVLINLLSNALKFTQTGSVQFAVHYRSPVAEFEVIDTGPAFRPATSNASLRRSNAARSVYRSRRPGPVSASPSAACSPA
jgi:signal transduction histidine kinase